MPIASGRSTSIVPLGGSPSNVTLARVTLSSPVVRISGFHRVSVCPLSLAGWPSSDRCVAVIVLLELCRIRSPFPPCRAPRVRAATFPRCAHTASTLSRSSRSAPDRTPDSMSNHSRAPWWLFGEAAPAFDVLRPEAAGVAVPAASRRPTVAGHRSNVAIPRPPEASNRYSRLASGSTGTAFHAWSCCTMIDAPVSVASRAAFCAAFLRSAPGTLTCTRPNPAAIPAAATSSLSPHRAAQLSAQVIRRSGCGCGRRTRATRSPSDSEGKRGCAPLADPASTANSANEYAFAIRATLSWSVHSSTPVNVTISIISSCRARPRARAMSPWWTAAGVGVGLGVAALGAARRAVSGLASVCGGDGSPPGVPVHRIAHHRQAEVPEQGGYLPNAYASA